MSVPRVQYAFTVTGKTPFPLDMLRYDSCYPCSYYDVDKLAEAMRKAYTTDKAITIMLVSYRAPTSERWESFGWTVHIIA